MSESKKREQRKERVFWTAKERKTVIDAAVLKWLGDIEHVWYYIAQGQNVLEPDRHRRIQGKAVVTPEILKMFEEARAELLDRKEGTEKPPEIPTPAATHEQALMPVPVDRAAVITNISTVELFEILGHRLGPFVAGFQAFAGILKTNINPSEHPEAPPVPASKEAVAPTPMQSTVVPPVTKPSTRTHKKTKVLLFGFNGEYEAEIKRRSSVFDLELLFISQPTGSPLPSIPICDWGIINRNPPITRRATEALKNRPGNKYLMDAGTPDTALQKLADINSRTK